MVTAAVVVLLAGVVLSGCESTAAGNPVPQSGASETSSQEPSSTESDRLAAPVEEPRDVRGIDACQLLTAQQLAELTFVEPGEKDTTPWGEDNCTWQNSNLSVGVASDTQPEHDGLEQAYRSRNNFENFAESSIGGFPAVRINEFAASQSCALVVGVADDQTIHLDFGAVTRNPAYEDPCGFAESVAAMVLENLPAG